MFVNGENFKQIIMAGSFCSQTYDGKAVREFDKDNYHFQLCLSSQFFPYNFWKLGLFPTHGKYSRKQVCSDVMFTVTHHHQKHVTLDENITLNQ
jgi:hypothetical protein